MIKKSLSFIVREYRETKIMRKIYANPKVYSHRIPKANIQKKELKGIALIGPVFLLPAGVIWSGILIKGLKKFGIDITPKSTF